MPQVFPSVTPTSISTQVQILANESTSGTLLNGAVDAAGNPSKAGFFGVGPVTQPTGGEQASTRGQAAGTVGTFATTATPAAITTLTTAEVTLTPIIGTGGTWTVTTTDVVLINKPTSQAGLGLGNVRYLSATTIAATFDNITAGTLTPTATQIYGVVALRGLGSTTQTLTPAAVATKTTVEQQFAVSGLTVGNLVQVNKPSVNAGLDIAGVRVVSSGVLGITYANMTAGTLTPTAEAYTIVSMGSVDATNNNLLFQGAIVGTNAIVTLTSANVTITSGNFAAQDVIVGVSTPFQAGIAATGGLVGTTTTNIVYVNSSATTITPTVASVVSAQIYRQNPAAPLVVYAVTLTPSSVATLTTAEQTFAVTGIVANSAVWVNKPSVQPGLGIVGCRVSSANNIAINYINTTGATLTPASETYIIGNFQMPIDTTTDNSWIQSAAPALTGDSQLVDDIRAAMVSLGLISGAA